MDEVVSLAQETKSRRRGPVWLRDETTERRESARVASQEPVASGSPGGGRGGGRSFSTRFVAPLAPSAIPEGGWLICEKTTLAAVRQIEFCARGGAANADLSLGALIAGRMGVRRG